MAFTRLGPNQSVNLASNVTGTLPAANGGSGRTAVTGNVLQVVIVPTFNVPFAIILFYNFVCSKKIWIC